MSVFGKDLSKRQQVPGDRSAQEGGNALGNGPHRKQRLIPDGIPTESYHEPRRLARETQRIHRLVDDGREPGSQLLLEVTGHRLQLPVLQVGPLEDPGAPILQLGSQIRSEDSPQSVGETSSPDADVIEPAGDRCFGILWGIAVLEVLNLLR